MLNFTTLFPDFLSNLRAITPSPVPTSSLNYSNDLRHLESNLLEKMKKLNDEYRSVDSDDMKPKKQLNWLEIPGEDSKLVLAAKKGSGETPYTFMHYLDQLYAMARGWDSYKQACRDSKEGTRDWNGEREKVKKILQLFEGATSGIL